MNRQLKAALVLRFGNQADAALAMGMAESRLSRLIHYRIPASDRERRALARVFGAERAAALLLGGENRRAELLAGAATAESA